MTGVVHLPKNNETALEEALTTGPISVCIDVNADFFDYSSGIYNSPCTCDYYGKGGTQKCGGHCVALVGYGSDANGNQYYILRNSWGTGWGRRREKINFYLAFLYLKL